MKDPNEMPLCAMTNSIISEIILTCDPSVYAMERPKLTAKSPKEESIRTQRVISAHPIHLFLYEMLKNIDVLIKLTISLIQKRLINRSKL